MGPTGNASIGQGVITVPLWRILGLLAEQLQVKTRDGKQNPRTMGPDRAQDGSPSQKR